MPPSDGELASNRRELDKVRKKNQALIEEIDKVQNEKAMIQAKCRMYRLGRVGEAKKRVHVRFVDGDSIEVTVQEFSFEDGFLFLVVDGGERKYIPNQSIKVIDIQVLKEEKTDE